MEEEKQANRSQNRFQRRNTLCPGELQRNNGNADFFSSDDNTAESGFEEEKMEFEQRFTVSMKHAKPPGRASRRSLVRTRMQRFASKVSDDLRFRDVMWKPAVSSMYAAVQEREKQKHKRFCDDGGFGWLSLDGRLVDVECTTCISKIGGNLGAEEKVAWEMFSPFQRVLVVAVAASAAANSKKGAEIKRLRCSINDRDQALNVMRRKLNDLWERIFFLEDQSGSIEKNKDNGDGVGEHEDDLNIEGLRNTCNWDSCGKGSEDGSRNWKGKTEKPETVSLDSPHAPCAAAILELKRRTEYILEKEASNVMAAFTSVLEKVEGLESYEAIQMHEGIQTKAQGFSFRDLKLSVEQASAQITSLQMSLFDMWHSLLPEVLCAVNISPSELDLHLDKAKKESSTLCPSRQFHTQTWKQWLNMQENAFEANFQPTIQDETEEDGYFYKMPVPEQEERRLSDMSDWSSTIESIPDQNIWPSSEADAASAIVTAVKKTMDKIIVPHDAQKFESNDGSQEMFVEKLLGELETAAVKVANMESELGRLKEYIKACDKKRKDAEEKLAEAVNRGIQNQLDFEGKEKEEIARLQKDCKQKDAIIKEMTLEAKKSKDASDKRLTILEEVCKKKNSTIRKLKEDVISLEEKISQLMRLKIPASLIWNNESSIPPVMSTNFLFDMDIPSSPDSAEKLNCRENQYLTSIEDLDLAAREYTSSSSWGYNETEQRPASHSTASSPATRKFRSESTGNSRSSSPTSARFRRESTGTSRSSSPTSARFRREAMGNSRSGQHSSKVNAGQSSCTRDNLWKNGADENLKQGSSCPPKIKTPRSSRVLSGVDTNSNLKSRRSSSESEEVQRSARNNPINKSKDITMRKRWM